MYKYVYSVKPQGVTPLAIKVKEHHDAHTLKPATKEAMTEFDHQMFGQGVRMMHTFWQGRRLELHLVSERRLNVERADKMVDHYLSMLAEGLDAPVENHDDWNRVYLQERACNASGWDMTNRKLMECIKQACIDGEGDLLVELKQYFLSDGELKRPKAVNM